MAPWLTRGMAEMLAFRIAFAIGIMKIEIGKKKRAARPVLQIALKLIGDVDQSTIPKTATKPSDLPVMRRRGRLMPTADEFAKPEGLRLPYLYLQVSVRQPLPAAY